MTITTLDAMESARFQRIVVPQQNLGVLGGGAIIRQSAILMSGIANTTSGVVPTNASPCIFGASVPPLQSFAGDGFISGIEAIASNNNANRQVRVWLYDRLFHVGAFVGNVGLVTLTGQPSFASRLPGGSYVGTQLFYEQQVVSAGNLTVVVGYTNQSGVAGRSTTLVAPTYGVFPSFEFPLQAGDTGVQRVDSVNVSGGTTTFNVVIGRLLFACSCVSNNSGMVGPAGMKYGMEQIGLARIYPTTCFWLQAARSPGTPDFLDYAIDVVCEP
jgi:hypothetical protein